VIVPVQLTRMPVISLSNVLILPTGNSNPAFSEVEVCLRFSLPCSFVANEYFVTAFVPSETACLDNSPVTEWSNLISYISTSENFDASYRLTRDDRQIVCRVR